jgi:hemerythrin
MQRLQLTEDLLTHHDVIDAQHAVLVDLLNEATTLVGVAGAEGMSHFNRLTDQLLDYAGYHFTTEEQLMGSFNYAVRAPEEAQLHVAEHRGFAARVLAMRAEFARDPRQVGGQVLVRFLQDWLVHHIGESDHDLGLFLEAATREGPAAAPLR